MQTCYESSHADQTSEVNRLCESSHKLDLCNRFPKFVTRRVKRGNSLVYDGVNSIFIQIKEYFYST